MTAAVEPETPQHDPDRIPYVRIVNAPKKPSTSGGVMPGFKTKLYVDGVDMSRAVVSATVTAHYKDVVRATLEVLPTEVEFEGLVAEIGPESRALLVALGWTPPAHEADATG